jgi:hypothetical protein
MREIKRGMMRFGKNLSSEKRFPKKQVRRKLKSKLSMQRSLLAQACKNLVNTWERVDRILENVGVSGQILNIQSRGKKGRLARGRLVRGRKIILERVQGIGKG